LEPIRDKLEEGLQNLQGDSDNRWSRTMRDEVKNIEITLSSTLAELPMEVEDLLKLKEGDILPFDMPDLVTLMAEDVPIARGKLGISDRNKKAIQIKEVIHHPAYREPPVNPTRGIDDDE
jgi:flagellar motor switch protein FliM